MQRDAVHLWHLALGEAMNEPDPTLASKKLDAAEAKIFHRIDGFARTSYPFEEQALILALEMIRCRRNRARVSDFAAATPHEVVH